jgi:hypothetical protein
MRIQLLAIPLLAAATFAAPQAETTTYVDGNLTGVSPNSGATLTFSGDKEMVLRTGLTNVTVPYENISHAELGAVKETSHSGSRLKIWARSKKTETQLLIVNFKSAEGEEKTMTLELAQPAASSVFTSIQSHKDAAQQVASNTAPAPAPPADDPQPAKLKTRTKLQPKPEAKAEAPKPATGSTDWWGDTWWKTTRNSDKWTKPTATNAPDQQ